MKKLDRIVDEATARLRDKLISEDTIPRWEAPAPWVGLLDEHVARVLRDYEREQNEAKARDHAEG